MLGIKFLILTPINWKVFSVLTERFRVINIACEVAKEVLLSHWSGKVKVFKNLKWPTCGEDNLDRFLKQSSVGIW